MRVTFTGVRLCANNESPVAHFAPATIASVGIQPSINTPHSALFIAVPISGQSSGGLRSNGANNTEKRSNGEKRRPTLVSRARGGPPASVSSVSPFLRVGLNRFSVPSVSLQSEDEHREPGRDRDVLLAVDRVRHGEAANLPADLHVPQRLARLCVEGEQVAFLGAAEHKSAGSRE